MMDERPILPLDDRDLRLLDAFARGDLAAADQPVFAARCRESPEFEAEARTRRAVMEAFFEVEKADFRRRAEARARKKRLRQALFAALAMAVTVGAGLFFWKKSQNRRPDFRHEPVAQTFYATPKNVLMGDEKTAPPAPEAFLFYDQNRFADAVAAFEKMPPTDTVFIFKASALLALEPPKTADALAVLQKIDSSSSFLQQKDWLRASALLLGGQRDAAKTAFEAIEKNERHGWRVKAKRVLETHF